MGIPSFSRLRKLQAEAQEWLEERDELLRREQMMPKWQKFAYFCVRVYNGFLRNRCLVRAAALAYTTVLALVPLLAIAVSVSTALLKNEGDEPIRKLVDQVVGKVAPMLDLKMGDDETAAVSRATVVKQIFDFISRFKSATLGVASILMFIFVATSLLGTIETTLNDIWGVSQGRSWLTRTMAYWVVLSLGPLLLTAAFSLTSISQVQATRAFLQEVGGLKTLLERFIYPCLILTFIFTMLYRLMPNTQVTWEAAAVGGTVAGVLLQVNSLLNVMHVTRVVRDAKLYGGLATVPLFLAGVYLSWVIVLLGAQVAYAYQNRRTYIQQRLAESINQRSREFVAVRLITYIGERFQSGKKAATSVEMAEDLGVPLRLVSQMLGVLAENHLIAELSGEQCGYSPARPLEKITLDDVLRALRVGRGQELETNPDPARSLLRTEFDLIVQAEEKAAASVNLAELIQRVKESESASRTVPASSPV